MLTELERPSQFRVLMRIPRLRHQLPSLEPAEPVKQPSAENAPPVLEYEVTEVTQQVVDDIATVRGRRWVRPVVLVQVIVVILAVVIALLSRQGGAPAPDASPDPQLQIPTVTLPAMSGTPPIAVVEPASETPSMAGGSPSEITGAPELTLPGGAFTNADPLTMIERLPPVSLESSMSAPTDGISPTAAAVPPAGQEVPGVARLDKRIETPKPDAQYDSSRSGLY